MRPSLLRSLTTLLARIALRQPRGCERRKRQESLTGDDDIAVRERIDSDRPGSEEAVAKMHGCPLGSRGCEVYPRRTTCKLSASAVEWRGGSAEEALNLGLRRSSRSVAVAHSMMSKAAQS